MKLKLSFCALMAFGFSNYLFASAIDPKFIFKNILILLAIRVNFK